jgi:hypothetical protein
LLELCDKPGGTLQWATELLEQVDKLHTVLNGLPITEAEDARLTWLETDSVWDRQQAVRKLRKFATVQQAADYIGVEVDELCAKTWPHMNPHDVVEADVLARVCTDMPREQIAQLLGVTSGFVDSLLGATGANQRNRSFREFVDACYADGLDVPATIRLALEAGYGTEEANYQRVYKRFKRFSPLKVVGK